MHVADGRPLALTLSPGGWAQVLDDHSVIGRSLFKKETNIQLFVGLRVHLSTGELGVIDSAFGQSGKFKVHIPGEWRFPPARGSCHPARLSPRGLMASAPTALCPRASGSWRRRLWVLRLV